MSNDNSNDPYIVVIDRNDGADPLVVGFTDPDQAEEFFGAVSDLVWEIGTGWSVKAPAQPVSPAAAARELLAEVARGVGDDDPNEVMLDPDVYREALKRVKVFAADDLMEYQTCDGRVAAEVGVTREEAIERMERAIGDEHGGGFRPGSFVGEAEAGLDALLDYLEENQARMLTVGGGQVSLGHALVSELVALLREAADG